MNLFSNQLIKTSAKFKSVYFSFDDLEQPEVYQLPIDAIKAVLTSYKKQVILLLLVILSFPVLSFVFENPVWIAVTILPVLRLMQMAVLVGKVDNILIQAKLLKARAEYKYDLERWTNTHIRYTNFGEEMDDYEAKMVIMRQWRHTGVDPYKHPFEIET